MQTTVEPRHFPVEMGVAHTRGLRAEAFEESVWEKVSGLVDHERAIRDAYDGYIAFYRRSASGENRDRLEKIVEEAEAERRGFLRLAAQGRMTDAELDDALAETDERRARTQRDLDLAREDEEVASGIEEMRDLLLEGVRRGFWSHGRTPLERADLYRKMKLRVTPDAEGEGMRLEFAYAGEEGFCEPNNPS